MNCDFIVNLEMNALFMQHMDFGFVPRINGGFQLQQMQRLLVLLTQYPRVFVQYI